MGYHPTGVSRRGSSKPRRAAKSPEPTGKEKARCERGLLRISTHTLFDLAFLAIHPLSQKVAIHPPALQAGYGLFDGVPLYTNGTIGPDRTALLFQTRIAESGREASQASTYT